MKRLALVYAFLTLPLYAQSGISRHDNVAYAYTQSGNTNIISSIPNALITVCNGLVLPAHGQTCVGLASIYRDNFGTQIIQQPFNADSFGNYGFYVRAGSYIVSVAGAGLTTYSYPLKLPCNIDEDCTITGNWTFTGTVNIPSGTPISLPLNLTKDSFTHHLTAVTLTGSRTWTLQDTSDTFVFLNTADILTNKTFDLSANSLINTTNTAGHYPRNDGTKYVDSTLQSGDIPAIILSVSGNGGVTGNLPVTNLANGLNADASHVWCGDASWCTPASLIGSSKIQEIKKSGGCTTGGSSYDSCTDVLTWPTSFGDTSYAVSCSGEAGSDPRGYWQISSYSATTVTFKTITGGSNPVTFGEIHCIGVHP